MSNTARRVNMSSIFRESRVNFTNGVLSNKVSYDQLIIFGTSLMGLCILTGKCTNSIHMKLAIYFETRIDISMSVP